MANNKSPLPPTRFLIVTVTAAVRYTASRATANTTIRHASNIWHCLTVDILQYFYCKAPSWLSAFLNSLSGHSNHKLPHTCTCFNPSSYILLWVLCSQTSLACLPSIGLGWTWDIGQTENRKQITGLTAWWDKLSSWAEMLDGWSWSLAWCGAGYKLQVISKIMEKLLSVCVLSRTHH